MFQFDVGGGKDWCPSDMENMDFNAWSGKYFPKDLFDFFPIQFIQPTTDMSGESDLRQLQFIEETF